MTKQIQDTIRDSHPSFADVQVGKSCDLREKSQGRCLKNAHRTFEQGIQCVQVNIYGQPPSSDIALRGDFEEITRILARIGVKANTFFIRRDGIQQFKNSGNAALNINLSPWLAKNTDAYYKQKFGIETLSLKGWPVGPKDTASFLRTVGEKLGIEKELVEKAVHEEELYVWEYLDSLFGNFERHRFILVGESAKALGLARFLVNMHGHIPLAPGQTHFNF